MPLSPPLLSPLDARHRSDRVRRYSYVAITVMIVGMSLRAAIGQEASSSTTARAADRLLTVNYVRSAAEPGLEISDDLRLDLLLREPTVANPLYMTFDERGRLWVVQYRQYPWPAGLKLLSRDSVWRNVYEPPFAPPPPHAADSPFRGHDRITIHWDADHDGTLEQSRVFLDGLNFATAALPGRGGVFVLNPPYLLFYADRDRDDRPDQEAPEILLSGFGIEDSHSIANSLRWGPDGWIYATQGSTVSGAIMTYDRDGHPRADMPIARSLGQNVWRYHPEERRYEIYAEGGGNAFGVEIDSAGRVYSGHNGGDTRGFHYIQDGYWQKNFSKHGQLSNPYAFDFHGPMRHEPVQRFTHTFCIYEADTLPTRYHGRLFGINPVEHHIVVSHIGADGASRQTHDLALVVRATTDERARWFTPVDIQMGPEGALYIADWYSVQPNHYRAHEGQTNPDLGRIYRLSGPDYRAAPSFDLAQVTSRELIDRYLAHPHRWWREQARRVLGDRRDASVIPYLQQIVDEATDQRALEAFWGFVVSGGLDEQRLRAALRHQHAGVRRWAVHLLGDHPSWANTWSADLMNVVRDEPAVEVRCQWAATAKRLSAPQGLAIITGLLNHADDVNDIYLPKTIWWSVESHANDHGAIADWLREPFAWQSSLRVAQRSLPENLMRRYALAGGQKELMMCATLLQRAPSASQRDALVRAFVEAHEGRSLPQLPSELAAQLAQSQGPFAELLAIRQNDTAAMEHGLQVLTNASTPLAQRLALMQALSDVQASPDSTIAALFQLLRDDATPRLQSAAIIALQKFSDPQIGKQLAPTVATMPAPLQAIAIQALSSRPLWARELLAHVASGQVPRSALDAEIIQRLRRHRDDSVQEAMRELFPAHPMSLSEKEARIESLVQMVRQGLGSPTAGRALFHGKATCGKCHQLFSQGGQVGPDLTPFNRTELSRLMLAIVHPSAEVREGYAAITVTTNDGQILSGLKLEQNDQLIVLRGTDGQDQTIAIDHVEEIIPHPTSLMPDGLLDELSEEELRDLFAFLASTTPPL